MGEAAAGWGEPRRKKSQQWDCTSRWHPVSPTELLHGKGVAADGEVALHHSEPWTLIVYPFSPFLSFNCREGRKASLQPSKSGGGEIFPITLAWRHSIIFSFLTPPTWKTETQRNSLCSFWRWEGMFLSTIHPFLLLWKSTQQFITGCNSTHLIQKPILTLLSYMKGHHGCLSNSIVSQIFLSMKYLLRKE